MDKVFLSAKDIEDVEEEKAFAYHIKQDCVEFEFPDGFERLRLIEECRAINALDVSDPDNFDFMYDITMQMLSGKVLKINFIEGKNKRNLVTFLVTGRYMDLRGVPLIDEYPCLVNWLVEFIAGMLAKKFPRSLLEIQATMGVRDEHLKSLKNPKKK